MKSLIKKFFEWIFKEQISELKSEILISKQATNNYRFQADRITKIFGNIDISVDVHKYSRSWAVISIEGEHSDYIKFVDLGKSDIRTIQNFLKNFERTKVDATPEITTFLKFKKSER